MLGMCCAHHNHCSWPTAAHQGCRPHTTSACRQSQRLSSHNLSHTPLSTAQTCCILGTVHTASSSQPYCAEGLWMDMAHACRPDNSQPGQVEVGPCTTERRHRACNAGVQQPVSSCQGGPLNYATTAGTPLTHPLREQTCDSNSQGHYMQHDSTWPCHYRLQQVWQLEHAVPCCPMCNACCTAAAVTSAQPCNAHFCRAAYQHSTCPRCLLLVPHPPSMAMTAADSHLCGPL